MSSSKDDDDVIFIEESSSVSTVKRSPPQRIIHEEPTPSNCITLGDDGQGDDAKLARVESFSRLLSLEQLIEARKSVHEIEHVPVLESMDVQIQPLPHAQDGEFGEISEGRTRKRPAKKILSEARVEKQMEKKRKAIEREISASLNSRCEQYMYCHVSRSVFDEFPESEVATRMVFADRDIQDQLVCEENSSNMVLWYRKCIEVLEGEGTVERREFKALQHVFAVVLSLNSLKELIRRGRLEDFVATRKLSYSVPSSTLILIIFGNNSRQVFDLPIYLFDCCRTQLHYVQNAQEFATYLVQVSRALAKMERRLANHDRLLVDVDKGIRDSTPDVLVHDWWDKMLAAICRMQDGQRRAVLSAYPNPFHAYKRFKEIGYTRAVQELAELQAESGRRLGPAMAHRLFMILTDCTGMEIVG